MTWTEKKTERVRDISQTTVPALFPENGLEGYSVAEWLDEDIILFSEVDYGIIIWNTVSGKNTDTHAELNRRN